MAISAGHMQGVGVYSRTGSPLGRISDLIIDESNGKVEYVIVVSGGFLGIGGTRSSLPWADIRFDHTKSIFVASHALPVNYVQRVGGIE